MLKYFINPSYSSWARCKGWTGSIADCIAGLQQHNRLPSFCSRFGIECCQDAELKQGGGQHQARRDGHSHQIDASAAEIA
jgi:hypothetical protein